jgi:hypothetical protein
MDRVDPKYRRFDAEMGAVTEPAAPPKKELAKPNFAAASAPVRPPAPPVRR